MKSTIARAKPQKGFYLGDHGMHSKLVSGEKKAFLKKLFFLTALVHSRYANFTSNAFYSNAIAITTNEAVARSSSDPGDITPQRSGEGPLQQPDG